MRHSPRFNATFGAATSIGWWAEVGERKLEWYGPNVIGHGCSAIGVSIPLDLDNQCIMSHILEAQRRFRLPFSFLESILYPLAMLNRVEKDVPGVLILTYPGIAAVFGGVTDPLELRNN